MLLKCNNLLWLLALSFALQQEQLNRMRLRTKLQKAMDHSSMNVSLTYLRGLEIAKLEENDMPKL